MNLMLSKQVHQMLYEPGDVFDVGCEPKEIRGIFDSLKRENPNKKIRAVSEWCWWDIEFPEKVEIPDGFQPAIIYSHYLVRSTDNEYPPGYWIRTTLLQNFRDDCIFETENTFYVLVGQGSRKSVDARLAVSIV